MSLYGRGVNDSIEKSFVSGVAGVATLKYEPLTWLDTKIAPGAVIETGSVSALYDSNQPRNTVFLDEALVNVKPFSFFTLSTGAINQRFLHSPLLIDAQSFPGALQNFHYEGPLGKFNFILEEAVPSSVSFSTLTSDKEPLPQLFTQTLSFEVVPNRDVKFIVRGTHFQFSDLPAQVAYLSSINGNSSACISGDVPQSKRFLCQFEGWQTGVEMDVHLATGVWAMTGGEYIVNEGAPSGENQGYMGFGQLRFAIAPQWRMYTRAEYFYDQSDTSPAFYNSPIYGHSNRQGYGGELRFENARSGFDVRFRYVDARLIETNPNQANTTIFLLTLGFFSATH